MELAARTRLGRYEVVAPLGAGAMGEVYRARDTQLDRTVAIKVLAAGEAGSKSRVDRFQREARAISRLHHANICTLYDVGEEGGRVFLVMEDLEGETLAHRLETGPLPIDEVLRHAIEMAAGLDGAHRHGVVHRDLKPANVMLTPDGVKILDFGLARLTDPFADDVESARDAQTHSGLVAGTLPYMAPEQLEDGEADTRTDIFALGAVMYEMTTGRRPFQAQSQAALIAAILSSEPPALDRAVPPALERALRRCLAKDPDERWQTARDLAAELRWIREGASAGTSAPDRDRWRSGARRLWPAAAVLGALALAFGLRAALPPRAPPPDTDAPAPRAVPAGTKALAVLPFENLGGPEDEYFADGITDELRGRLARLPGLLVIASSSSNEYKKTTKAPRQIAGELGVQYLLVGKVRWEKGKDGQSRVRVSPELIEAATISTWWQQPFDAVLTDVFEVQATIATQVAQALGVALEQGERTRMAEKPTSNLAAWDAYLQGNEAMHGFETPADLVRALGPFDRAVAARSGLRPRLGPALPRPHRALHVQRPERGAPGAGQGRRREGRLPRSGRCGRAPRSRGLPRGSPGGLASRPGGVHGGAGQGSAGRRAAHGERSRAAGRRPLGGGAHLTAASAEDRPALDPRRPPPDPHAALPPPLPRSTEGGGQDPRRGLAVPRPHREKGHDLPGPGRPGRRAGGVSRRSARGRNRRPRRPFRALVGPVLGARGPATAAPAASHARILRGRSPRVGPRIGADRGPPRRRGRRAEVRRACARGRGGERQGVAGQRAATRAAGPGPRPARTQRRGGSRGRACSHPAPLREGCLPGGLPPPPARAHLPACRRTREIARPARRAAQGAIPPIPRLAAHRSRVGVTPEPSPLQEAERA